LLSFYQPGTAQPIPSGSAGYFLEYWHLDKNNRVIRFSWITELAITFTPENVEEIMRAGRASVEDRKPNLQYHKKPGVPPGASLGTGQEASQCGVGHSYAAGISGRSGAADGLPSSLSGSLARTRFHKGVEEDDAPRIKRALLATWTVTVLLETRKSG
jgi:hypothetical protein